MHARRLVAALGWGASIGGLGGLVGLGGAEFRLPVLLGVFRFRPPDAVILNKALSLIVVAAALVFRTRSVPLSVLTTHWSIAADLLGRSLLGAWFGAGWAIRMRGDTFHRIIAVLLVLITVVLLLGHHATAERMTGLKWPMAISQAGVVDASRPENLPFAPSSHSSSKRTFAHLLENVSLKMSYSPTYALLCMENAPITV